MLCLSFLFYLCTASIIPLACLLLLCGVFPLVFFLSFVLLLSCCSASFFFCCSSAFCFLSSSLLCCASSFRFTSFSFFCICSLPFLHLCCSFCFLFSSSALLLHTSALASAALPLSFFFLLMEELKVIRTLPQDFTGASFLLGGDGHLQKTL